MAITEAAQDETGPSVSRPSPTTPPRRERAALFTAGGVGLLATVLFLLVRGGLTDDAYITLDYSRNMALHGHWGVIEEEFANTATSPLNVLALAAVTAVLRQPITALGVVFVLANALLAWCLHRSAEHSGLPALTGAAASLFVLLNPFLLSSVGLEMSPASALLGLLLLGAVRPHRVLFGVAAGLLALTRLDLGVFVLVLLLGRPTLWRAWWRWLVPACAVALPWFTLSWWSFGSAVPDTLVIKQQQENWGEWTFGNGLQLYHSAYPTATAAALAAAVIALLALPVWLVSRLLRRRTARLLHCWALFGLAGATHFCVYTTLGVPPYHWYYVPAMIGLSVFAAAALAAVSPTYRGRGGAVPLLATTVAVALGAGVLANQARVVLDTGVPWRHATITTNWATPSDYARIGRVVGGIVGEDTVRSPGEIGTLAYHCECAVVDGLSDRGYLAPRKRERIEEAGPVTAALLRFNYRHFTPTEPREVDYVLRRAPGPAPNPVWTIDSPWSEPSHLVLERAR
ncbi:hypothetical protein [Actinopolyspora mortivallis]|uniref:DUF2029 domain-containing protein n=1 Tax=Actinopolyspora mortivallis TaxID=33906 RepID=A0A2T0GYL3_ACTMO|nr:hypothetical protein [Actinopolyspora mortivallis]PRW64191.1 hypothetical protein CEP50_06015 [Actinopolyspora mortivallis]